MFAFDSVKNVHCTNGEVADCFCNENKEHFCDRRSEGNLEGWNEWIMERQSCKLSESKKSFSQILKYIFLISEKKASPEKAVKFISYEQLKVFFVDKEGKMGGRDKVICGALAGAICHTASFPLEVMKVRLETSDRTVYNGITDVFRKTYLQQGLMGFYRGMGPALLGISFYTLLLFCLYPFF